jgi:hypothetical protein
MSRSITVTLSDIQAAAMQKECDAFNAPLAPESQVTLDAFVEKVMQGRGDSNVELLAVMTSFAFAKRFTDAEYAAIVGSADPEVAYYVGQLKVATTVDLRHPLVADGLALLVSKGLLTSDRPTAILALI